MKVSELINIYWLEFVSSNKMVPIILHTFSVYQTPILK